MKRFLMTTAIVLSTTAGAAYAQSDMNAEQLRAAVGQYLATSTFEVDVNSLTDTQLAALHGAITSTDSEGERDREVYAVLNDANVEMKERPDFIMVEEVETPRDQIYISVQNALEGTEFEGKVWSLSDAQLSAAYGFINSTDSETEKEQKLRSLFN